MNKEEINTLIEKKHETLFNWIYSQPEEKWNEAPENKRTVGQQIAHLVESIKQVNHAMSFPPFILKYKFGTSNRDVRDYDDIVKRYQEKLAKHQEKAKEFNANLGIPDLKQRKKLLNTLQIQQKKLQHKTNRWKDHNLNNLILPHPLMGKMPIREIIMWTAYHTEHHTNDLVNNY